MKAHVYIPNGYDLVPVGHLMKKGDYCLDSKNDGLAVNLFWDKLNFDGGEYYTIKKGTIIIRKIKKARYTESDREENLK